MRSLIIVVTCIFGLALGFLVYFWSQPTRKNTASHQKIPAPSLVEGSGDPNSSIGNSDNIYIKKPDKNGNLASEYWADEAKPAKGGIINVTRPKARFYLNAGQVLEIDGADGVFVEDHASRRGVDDKAQTGAPTRGRLHNVTVRLLDTNFADPDQQTMLTITMNNAAFDSENTTIYTEAFRDRSSGVSVPADEVPVTLRGTDYDFDGRGLKISWNDRDRRLAKLDVMHGERLVIKNPAKFSAAKPPTTEPVGNPVAMDLRTGAPVLLASADDVVMPPVPTPAATTVAGEEPVTTPATMPTTAPSGRRRRGRTTIPPPVRPKIVPSSAPPLYRATFLDHVQILGLTPQEWSNMSDEQRRVARAAVDAKQTPQQLRDQHFEMLAIADRMFVDFMLRPENTGEAQPTTGPATTQSAPSALTSSSPPSPTTGPTTAPVASGRHGRGATTVATTAPVTKPAESPMYVYWTGPLHVEPYALQPLSPGDSVVTLEGAPVVAHQQTSEIRSARLIYRTQDRDVQADAAPNSQLTMTTKDAHGDTIIHTQSMTYMPAKPSIGSNTAGVAVLRGRSNASLPAQADGGKLNATWARECTLTFVNLDAGHQAIERAELIGDVKVDHPQLKLDAQELDLTFDNHPTTRPATRPALADARNPATRPATQPALEGFQSNLNTILATNQVHCVMINPEKKLQTIDCDRLTVLNSPTSDGHFSPRTINADGQVHAVDTEQDLTAGHLAVTLMPSTKPTTKPTTTPAGDVQLAAGDPATHPATQLATTRPSDGFGGNVELQSLLAHDSVKVINYKDGTVATADTLLVDRDKVDGKPTVRLVGQPFAKIIDKTSIITGPIIVLFPDGQQLAVDGGGTMHGTQQETPGSTTKPIDVTWDRSMRIDGKKNVVDALGNVVAVLTDADGSVDIAKGDRVQLLLVDLVPATQPATRPTTQTVAVPTTQPVQVADLSAVPATNPATHPARRAATTSSTGIADASPMGHKGVRRAVFQDNSDVTSTLLDADGGLLRRMHVKAETIQYDVNQTGDVAEKKITIPVPGRMLVEDYRQPATQPATQQASGPGQGGARGVTAFQWQKSLVYDDATKLMVMEGNVIINHRDDPTKEDAMHLTGDTVTALMEALPPTTRPATRPTSVGVATTNPATRPAPTDPRYQVKHLTAKGNLVLTLRGIELDAETMDYDPATHIVKAHGGNRPAVFNRASAGERGSRPMEAEELEWDTQSELPKITKASGRMSR